MNKHERLKFLFSRYVNDASLSEKEAMELQQLISDADLSDDISDLMDRAWKGMSEKESRIAKDQLMGVYDRIVRHVPTGAATERINWTKIAAAIFLLFTVSFILYRFLDVTAPNSNEQKAVTEIPTSGWDQDMEPGNNRAYLVLDNGRKIDLSSLEVGSLVDEGSDIQARVEQGKLFYVDGKSKTYDEEIIHHTIEVPKGGQYSVSLSDGTHVWLNSGTTLSFPLKFKENKRKVKLVGEGYFEVAKDTKKPFVVDVDGKQTVEVLGTHFNIKAYPDESEITTTLMEGGVRVRHDDQTAMLNPGQQSNLQLVSSQSDFKISPADIDAAMDWKNGYFVFNDENIKSMMQRLSRWYDFEVEYVGNLDDVHYLGNYSKEKSLGKLLQYIETTGKVKFDMEAIMENNKQKRRRVRVTAIQ